jgi:hypothetical protein
VVRLAVAPVPPAAAICAVVAAVLVPLRRYEGPSSYWRDFLAAIPRRCAAIAATGLLLRYLLSEGLASLWFGAIWPVVAIALDPRSIARALVQLELAGRAAARKLRACVPPGAELWLQTNPWIRSRRLWESVRVLTLLLAALWLLRGFYRVTLSGTADAYWYALNLADTVAQVRAGVFPVWVGQSLYQFNGAVCPVRVAPAFHYLGALADLVTLHQMGTFALMNLMITVVGVCGMFSAYVCLRSLIPASKWLAAALAALFLACPGTLGLAYNSDLYMSWMSLPFVPLVWFATIRSYEDGGAPGTLAILGSALGMCWWAHPPIALWLTLLAGLAQAVRVFLQFKDGLNWGAHVLAAVIFASIAAYPLGSVLLFPAGPGGHMSSFQRASSAVISMFVREGFPAAFLPMSAGGRSAGDFQIGYSLWALLGFLIWRQRRAFQTFSVVPLALAFFLALLIIPFPGINSVLWLAVPGFVRDTTGNWAMSRLCMILAAAIVFSAAAYWKWAQGARKGRRRIVTLVVIVTGLCAWSFHEAGKFAIGSRKGARTRASATDLLRPEAIQLTRYSYSMFPTFPEFPRYFTHGVSDPNMENRLLTKDTLEPFQSNAAASVASGYLVAAGDFKWGTWEDMRYAMLDRKLQLEQGQFYSLEFTFAQPDRANGILQILGRHFFREYSLPDYGGSKAFGAGGDHGNILSVFSTSGPEDLTVRFIPAVSSSGTSREEPVARVRQFRYDRDSLPVRVDSWMPFKARVRSPAAAWVETPRAYQAGYRAWVDGKPAEVRESRDSLVCVAVPAGESRVELAYAAPPGLRVLFWLSFLSIVAAAGFGAWRVILHLRGAPSPAKASGTPA